jgi:hypothetical protein
MTIAANDTPSSITIPPFAAQLLHNYGQKALTALAAFLIGHGFLPAVMQGKFVEGGLGVATFIGSCILTYIATRVQNTRTVDAANAPAPPIPITSAGGIVRTS